VGGKKGNVLNTQAAQLLAREAAAQGLVLLQNNNSTLPLPLPLPRPPNTNKNTNTNTNHHGGDVDVDVVAASSSVSCPTQDQAGSHWPNALATSTQLGNYYGNPPYIISPYAVTSWRVVMACCSFNGVW
jgi:hypothetical protein